LIELGRACVHQQHRNLNVLGLLWKEIAVQGNRYGLLATLLAQVPVGGSLAVAGGRAGHPFSKQAVQSVAN